jgi:hypothetical protein
VRELGPFLARVADTQFEKGFDGEPTTLRFPAPRLTTIKRQIESDRDNVRLATERGEGYSLQNNALILGGPPHVVVRVISKLEYMWWKGLLFIGYAAMLGGILVKNRVGIGSHELVWIDSDERRAADASINGIRKKSFTNTRDDGIIRKG